MNDLNLCQFIGRLGKDPETRYSQNGDAITNLSIGCNWKSREKDGVEWVRVVFFGKAAEVVSEYAKKGSQMYVAGRMMTRKWQDKDGQDRYTTEIRGNQFQFLGGRKEKPESARETPEETTEGFDDFNDDILF